MNGHILVIEDEVDVYDVMHELLEEHGFTISWASHPREAEVIARDRGEPDLILMDLMLPGLDGVKLAAQLRCNGFAHTPIIALSASKIMLHFARESELFQECVAKPFDLTELLSCVESYVGTYITNTG